MLGSRHLRHQLAITYAGIALLTALILGGVMLSVLGSYYARAEDAYLRASATRIARDLELPGIVSDLDTRAKLFALVSQARVRIYDSQGTLLGDSGSPRDIDPGTIAPFDEDRREPRDRERLPGPLGSGIFGGADTSVGARSSRTLRYEFQGPMTSSGAPIAALVLSEAPASGRDVLTSIIEGWLVAAAIGVALAALAGYLLSNRISRPLVALTETSDRMAAGDLGARADIDREDEVGRLAVSFNAMADRIESIVIELRRFVADAAHEIGTPLTALQADLELAEDAATTPDEVRLVRRARTQAVRLEDLSRNLLRLSRIETGDRAAAVVPVDVALLARDCADAVASAAEQAGIAFEVRVEEGPLVVAAEEARLQVVIENLLSNALKFTPSGGSVSLVVSREGDVALLAVADTGVGIPEAEHDRVFSRFHRARNAAAYPGSGLGLAIVRATVESFGGSVGFESSAGGSRFDVRLPLARDTGEGTT